MAAILSLCQELKIQLLLKETKVQYMFLPSDHINTMQNIMCRQHTSFRCFKPFLLKYIRNYIPHVKFRKFLLFTNISSLLSSPRGGMCIHYSSFVQTQNSVKYRSDTFGWLTYIAKIQNICMEVLFCLLFTSYRYSFLTSKIHYRNLNLTYRIIYLIDNRHVWPNIPLCALSVLS